jgi:phosphopentomutase
MRTGSPIVYTSADSVFQVAAHEEVIPLWELYKICETARAMLRGPYEVGRVIARPFTWEPGSFTRTPNRKDYAVPPPKGHAARSARRTAFGAQRRQDLRRFPGPRHPRLRKDQEQRRRHGEDAGSHDELDAGLIFVNLVDFDQQYGHRNDVEGYAKALEKFDALAAGVLRRCAKTTSRF